MIEKKLQELFFEYFACKADNINSFPAHASNRKLYRITGGHNSCIGVYHSNIKENRSFFSFAKTFISLGLPVPEIYKVSDCEQYYIEADYGDETLFSLLQNKRQASQSFPEEVAAYYRQALSYLVKFQVKGKDAIDFGVQGADSNFGARSMLEDLTAFQKEFLTRKCIEIDPDSFSREAKELVEFLLQAPSDYFMYRDFQSRNIMVHNQSLAFIDFQAGMRGPLQYDVVSLLYQSQAELPVQLRDSLLEHYLEELEKVISLDTGKFKSEYYGYVFLRLFQVLATYAREGLGKKKEYFLNGIPKAIHLLSEVTESHGFPVPMPEFSRIIHAIVEQNQ